MSGTRPSTLLGLQPEFTSAFGPDTTTTGVAASILGDLGHGDVAFARPDHIAGDPMTGRAVWATDVGYRRAFGKSVALSGAYQWKTTATDNDDAVNTRLQVSLGIVF